MTQEWNNAADADHCGGVSSDEEFETVYLKNASETAEEEPLSFDEKLARAKTMVMQNPKYRRIFFEILRQCKGAPKGLADLEEAVASHPDYNSLKRQPPYFPIHWLEQSGALDALFETVDGVLLDEEAVGGWDEDTFDDCVVGYAYETSEVGLEVLEIFNPVKQTQGLFDDEPGRADMYREVLRFSLQKRSFAEIDHFIRNNFSAEMTADGEQRINPSMYVDKLAAVGSLCYERGWVTTPEGKELIAEG